MAEVLLAGCVSDGLRLARVFAHCGYDPAGTDELIIELKRIVTEGQLVEVVESPYGLEKTMVHELDTVVITRDIKARGIVAGEGTALAVETLPISDIRPVGAREILHARPLEKSVLNSELSP